MVKKYFNCYKAKVGRTIRNMKSTNPKTYWNFLNEQNQKFQAQMPDCDTFLNMFKAMNENQCEEYCNIEGDNWDGNCSLLNDDITELEVRDCIKRLKNNKACGLDNLINEFFKTPQTI